MSRKPKRRLMSPMLPRPRPGSRMRRSLVPLRALGATPEALDLTPGVDDALRTGEERMADGAHLCLQLGQRRTRRERVAAEAVHDRVSVVFGMDSGFHGAPARIPGN